MPAKRAGEKVGLYLGKTQLTVLVDTTLFRKRDLRRKSRDAARDSLVSTLVPSAR